MKYAVSVNGHSRAVEVGPDGILIDGRAVEIDVSQVGDSGLYSIVMDGHTLLVVADRAGKGRWSMRAQGHDVSVEVLDERAARVRALTAQGAGAIKATALKAPMPGMVVKIEVAEGDLVEVGQGLVIVEAMKMENELKATVAGRVAKVLTEAGQAVDKDQVLIEFAKEGDS
ncbi:MAG: biotin/lipoyl-containing protein [Longimicrobiales bacterium]